MPKRRTRPVTVGDVTRVLDEIAPPVLAQSWDNVGLLVGDRSAPCRSVLFCIDLTPPVLEEAIGSRCDLVLAYHPPLFQPVTRLLADSGGTDAVVGNLDDRKALCSFGGYTYCPLSRLVGLFSCIGRLNAMVNGIS